MESSRLEKYKKRYKAFADKIAELQRLLEERSAAVFDVILITPYQVSRRLGVTEMDATFLLSLAEQEHLVSKKYSVFSDSNDDLLDEYNSPEEIPKVINNPATGSDVDRDHYYVSLSYELAK